MNNFEYATRKKLRFASSRGMLNVEQLWDLPLESRDGFDIDAVGQVLIKEIEQATTKSLVKKSTSASTELEIKLDIVKGIIATKQSEIEKRKKSAEKRELRNKIAEVIASKKDEAISSMSLEELQKKLEALEADED